MVKRNYLLALVLFICSYGHVLAQPCPADNAFFANFTPTVGAGNSTASTCVLTGEYITTNVCAGATYTWSTCASGLDLTSTLRNNATLALITSDDDGCGTFAGPTQITWTATFTGTVRFYIDQDPCINSGLCVPVVVTQNSACGTGAGTGPCNTSVGTFNIDVDGVPTSLGSTVYLCNDGSCINATSNGDYVLPGSVLFGGPCVSSPELMWAFYTAPPTTGNPSTDPAWDGTYWSGSDFNECLSGGSSSLGNPQNSEWWIAPITGDDGDNDGTCGGLQHDGDGDGCFVQGAPLHVVYLTPITNGTPDVNCYNGVVTVQILGGMPAYDGSNYTVTNTGAGSIVSGPVTDGEYVVVNGLSDGDSWSFDVTDGAGCSQTISGTYNECPCPTVDYSGLPATIACDDPAILLQADESSMAPGESVSPCYYVQIMPTNGNANNVINYYENGTLIGTLTPGANTMYQGFLSFVSPSANNTVELCDISAGTNMEYLVMDCHSGNVIASGTWIADGAGCEVINVTPPSTNVSGTSTWSSTPVPGAIIATSDAGAALFDPGTAGAGVHDVTYTWDDGNGCTGSSTQQVTVTDAVAPAITCPSNVTVNNDPGTCGATVNTSNPSPTDNCGINTVTWTMTGATTGSSPATGINYVGTSNFNVGTTTITYTVTDFGNNTANCSFTVTVNDNEDPVINCPPNITVNNDAGLCSAVVTFTAPVGTDNCPGAITNQTTGLPSGSAFPVGTTTNTFVVTDGAGNTATCSFTVTVNDNEDPVINCPADIIVGNDVGNCSAVVNYNVTASDNCLGETINQTAGLPSGSTFPVGTTTNTFEVTDAAGNTVSCSFDVTVNDTEDPVINCPADITVNNDIGNCSAVVTYTAPVGTDNCPGATTNQTAGLPSGSAFPVGTTTNTFEVIDAAGNAVTCSFTVTVNDAEDPVINCPSNIIVNNDPGNCSAVVNYNVTSSDNCPGETINQTAGLASGATFPAGTTTNTFEVTDAAGNTVTCSFTVTVNDTEDPTAVCQPFTVNLDGTGNATIVGTDVDGGSTDNCGIVNYSVSPSSFTCADIGSNTVTLTVEDAAGNSSTCTATVTVNDNEVPNAVCQPFTVSLDASGNASIVGTDVDGGSTDNCGIVNYSVSPSSFTCADIGANTVTLTVEDAAGNSSTCTATVTVDDPNVPTADAGANDVICSSDTYTLSATSGGSASAGTWSTSGDGSFTPGVTDPNATYTPGANDITNGSVTLTWTTDPSPCSTASANMTLTINPDPTPTITGDTEYCEGNVASISTGAFSSYNWSNGANSQNTTVTIADNPITVTVTDANGCTGTSAPYNVTENPNPEISLTPNDPTVCDATDGFITVNSVSGLTDGDVTWSGTASGTDNAITLPHDITGLGAGNYNVTFTDINGCSSSIESTVLNNPGAPVIDGLSDTSSCEVDFVVPDPTTYITGTNLTGNQAFYSASGGNVADEIPQGTVITSGMTPMTIYVYDNSGTCSSEISFVVEVNENPTTTISPDPAVTCEGTSINLDGNPTGGSGVYSTHAWTGDVSILSGTGVPSTSTLAGAASGTYNLTYTVTDDNGCVGTDDIVVEINEQPVLSGDQEICEDEVTTISSTGTPDGTTPWSSSDASVASVDLNGDVTGVSAGTADITFLDANGCSETITITVNPKPTITLTPNDPTTCNGTDGFITVDGAGNGVVDWSGTASGTSGLTSLPYDITNLEAGNYDVTFTDDGTGCVSDQASTVLNNPGAPVIDNIDDTSSCEVDYVIPDPTTYITGTNLTGNQAFYSAPGGNAGDELVQGTTITTGMSPMTVYVYDANGVCETEISFVVEVNENPTVSISPNPIDACTDEDVQLNGNPSGGSGNYAMHDWTGTGSSDLNDQTIVDPLYNSSVAGNYDLTYTVEDDNGCSASETIVVTIVERTVIDPISPITSCGELPLDSLPAIVGTNLSGSEDYYDDTQANGGQVVAGPITTSGTYYAYDAGGNCSNEVMVDITINEVPTITSTLEDTAYCDYETPDDIVFNVTGQPDWTIEYTLDGTPQTTTSSQNTINLGNNSGVYNITVIQDNVCSDTVDITFELNIKPTPPAPTVFEDTEYCISDELDSMRAEGTGGVYSWYLNDLNDFIGNGEKSMPFSTTGTSVYYITETMDGCESEPSSITIDIIECEFVLSTAFTPDNDGLNDTWELPDLDNIYPNNVVQVYNRWGSLIFEHDSSSEGPYNQNPWDGTFNGKELPVGSYYFVIDHNDGSGETTNGAVSIIID